MESESIEKKSMEEVLKIFLKDLTNTKNICSTYDNLININKVEGLQDECKKSGGSMQKVYVCNEHVYKCQPLNIYRIIKQTGNDVIEVDSFTMNDIMQYMMKSIVDKFDDIHGENLEHPLSSCVKDNHLIF